MARKKSSIGCLFWIALILLVLVIFLLNRNTIETVLEKTGLVTYLTRNRDNREPESDSSIESTNDSDIPVVVSRQIETDSAEVSDSRETDEIVVIDAEETQVENEEATETSSNNIEPETRARKSTLFFVEVDENGGISLSPITRPVNFVDSPLTNTLQILLKGLNSSEISKGLLSLVPEGTQLKGVTIRENTAFINFNDSFRFNRFGKEGYKYQLKQIVYTATEFQTVEFVQILVDGEVIPYLGPESPFVGQPLTRDMLN